MNAKLHTFFDIFSATFPLDNEEVQLRNIVIPKIQRDYAQGRETPEIAKVRKRFLSALKDAILGKNITLDFVYGNIDINGIMTPLDGQQRLTTLFLLHIYAAKKENIASEEYNFLNQFSYETRYSARDFCSFIVNQYQPTFERSLTKEIVDQAWFPLDWQKDPTIHSMLVMLDAIDNTFANVTGIWNRLKEGAISFYFLALPDMGLTDELYIKMNSRGKPLTQFEHFKAELEHNLRIIDPTLSSTVMQKIDKVWTDLLWQYRNDDNIIDDEFLRYFRFICDILCYQAGGTPHGKSNDEFDLLNEYFSKSSPAAIANIDKLVSMFDCWCNLVEGNPSLLINKFVSESHEANKVIFDTVDIFSDCLRNYADVLGNGNRRFPLNRIILLFAFVVFLKNRASISDADFARRLRIVNNLVLNSPDDISDAETRASGNRLPAILQQVEQIILFGQINLSIKNALNVTQLNEEIEKSAWLETHQAEAESLFALEDHELLYGQISIVGTDNPDLFPRFASLFNCNWDLVDCALMATGMYAQQERNWRYQLGSHANRNLKAWRTLFHKSKSTTPGHFDNTKAVLCALLSKTPHFTDSYLKEIVNAFISKCENNAEFPIQYYYIKYPHFRPGSYGKYTWEDLKKKPYELAVMLTERNWSEYTYQPFLKTVDDEHLSKEHKGQRIVLEHIYIVCVNNAFVVYRNETDEELKRIPIAQNEAGVDTENRLEKIKHMYKDILALNLDATMD